MVYNFVNLYVLFIYSSKDLNFSCFPEKESSITECPVEAYNSYGNVVWQADYDIYGDLRSIKGIRDFIPFRQLGQYEDDETRLYYNRSAIMTRGLVIISAKTR